ncbi:MAG: uracil phosphoribosyltransferase [Crocinitomicaceae bacterium]|nr:uracil phosphoribosyltransferase [Crocinitomicaceae bacterium]|tara:strand:- start:151 stop:807 length:657 start_codon:yes stop_codon:yes gene_type:complete
MGKVIVLGEENSIFNQFLYEMRNIKIQKDRLRFRKNLERCGEIFAYEISKKLEYKTEEVHTPLGDTTVELIDQQPILATVLRAGLPLHQGLLNYFDHADNGFISAYRMHHKDNEFEVKVEYVSCKSLEEKTLILSDPMLATGNSMVLSYQTLIEEFGEPKEAHIVSVIASTEGVEFVKNELPDNVTIWLGAVDDEMTAQSYIVPGLGDAGDLAFGEKE